MDIQRQGQDDRELALRKYFKGLPEEPSTAGATFFALLGLAISLIAVVAYFNAKNQGASDGSGTLVSIIIGVVMAGGGFLLRLSLSSSYKTALEEVQPQPADEEIDRWFQESVDKLCQHSRIALNLTEEEADHSYPLLIVAPTLSETYGVPQDEITWRKGLDKRVRFVIYKAAVIHLTDRHLGAFTCDFNFIRNVPLNESTQEYHYCDVVSVSTAEKSQAYVLPTGQKLTTSKIFALSVSSGESIQVPIDVEQIRKMTGLEIAPETGTDKAVSTIRAMLRDKKETGNHWQFPEAKAS
jgi:hypothetical protein